MNKFFTFVSHLHHSIPHQNYLTWNNKGSTIEKTKCDDVNGDQTLNLNSHICPGSSKNAFHNDLAKSNFTNQLNKLGLQNLVRPIPIFESKLNFPKIQNKFIGSFINILGASMNNFIIFGNI